MKLKEMWKRFWTLDVHNHEGFTLVELIIVIAILAILSTGAIAGYSVYIKQANMTADEALAAEIQNALILAMYSGELTPGDYVVIQFGDNATSVGDDINEVMTAAYGENWKQLLQLKWDGWDNGVAGNKEVMGIVDKSNFKGDAMDSMLGQVQLVVDLANDKISSGNTSFKVTEELAEILAAQGIRVTVGESVPKEYAMAAANGLVYMVAGNLASLDISPSAIDSDAGVDAASAEFMGYWGSGFPTDNTAAHLDGTSCAAAEYARVYALALYVDKELNLTGNNSYAAKMDNDKTDPRRVAETVLAEIYADTDADTARKAYYLEDDAGISLAYNDAVAFLAYMQGTNKNQNTLLGSTDLNNTNYFGDGYIANYVSGYLALSMPEVDGSAFVFIYTGTDIAWIGK